MLTTGQTHITPARSQSRRHVMSNSTLTDLVLLVTSWRFTHHKCYLPGQRAAVGATTKLKPLRGVGYSR